MGFLSIVQIVKLGNVLSLFRTVSESLKGIYDTVEESFLKYIQEGACGNIRYSDNKQAIYNREKQVFSLENGSDDGDDEKQQCK